jgi:ATP/maltotriose-dependent transcriptional regulator MalT
MIARRACIGRPSSGWAERACAATTRAHLLYGEWLRRDGQRIDVREHLRTAHQMFTETGMEAFAERARRELLATGGTVRQRRTETRDEPTAQEAQIARLVRDGLSNPEIGARLFLSPRHNADAITTGDHRTTTPRAASTLRPWPRESP